MSQDLQCCRTSTVTAILMCRTSPGEGCAVWPDLQCGITSPVSRPSLSQDLHCHSTSHVSSPRLRDLYWHREHTIQVPPGSQHLHCLGTFLVPLPSLSLHLHSVGIRTFIVRAIALPQDLNCCNLQCCRTCTVTGLPLS